MIEETIGGPASSSASHCAAKSGGVASPAVAGTSGPHCARKARTAASCGGVAARRRIGNPQVELERAVAAGAELRGPVDDGRRLHQQRAAGAEAAGIGDRDRQRRRAGTRHGREQDRRTEPETLAELPRAAARRCGLVHAGSGCADRRPGNRQNATAAMPLPPGLAARRHQRDDAAVSGQRSAGETR